jgi:hypothetical protein
MSVQMHIQHDDEILHRVSIVRIIRALKLRGNRRLVHINTCRFTRGADKSLARPISRCILFDGENISFDASLVVYINSINIPPIMIVNRIYETQNLLSL